MEAIEAIEAVTQETLLVGTKRQQKNTVKPFGISFPDFASLP